MYISPTYSTKRINMWIYLYGIHVEKSCSNKPSSKRRYDGCVDIHL